MKRFLVLIFAFLVSGIAITASADSGLYIVERSIVSGRKISNFPIQGMNDLARTRLFGMNKNADTSIAALESQKAYKCDADGSFANLEVNSGVERSGTVSIFKLYNLSNCTEVTRGEVLRAEKQKDEDKHTK